MADIKKYFPKVLPWEGNGIYHEDKGDMGGATKDGVTIATWQSMGYDKNHDGHIDKEDLKLITADDAMAICKKGYWDKWQADKINNQSIAESLVEWVWASGRWGFVIPQRLLGVVADGSVGQKTLDALNSADPAVFYDTLLHAKYSFIDGLIAAHPEQIKWQHGWLNRINAFKFVA